MESGSKIFREVAQNCSAFDPVSKVTDAYNGTCCSKSDISCVTCKHFDEDKYCKLDLYDKIVKDHDL